MTKYEIIIGDIYDLKNPPPEGVAAVCSCIHRTNGETIRNGKPFLGLNIREDNPIMPSQFDEGIEFIKKYIGTGDIVVACEQGLCRSVSISIAYYVNVGMTFENATKKIGRSPSCPIHENSLLNYVRRNGLANGL